MRNTFDYYDPDDYLEHYGVIGMKWGVHRNPQKAYAKATKKFNRLVKRSDRALDKAGRNKQKLNKQSKRGVTRRGHNKRYTGNLVANIARQTRKSMRSAKRASNWMNSMKREFAKQSVVSIDPVLISRGDAMLDRYRSLRINDTFN